MDTATSIGENNLFLRLKAGEAHAFDELFHALYPGLCFFARKYVSESGLAEEIVQDVMVKLWERRKDFDRYVSLKSFLYISIKNACLDSLIKEKRKQQRENNYYLLTREAEIPDEDMESRMIHTEVLIEISQAIEQLPEQCRKVMKMSFEEGLNGKEIAEALQLSVSTIHNQKSRGIHLLRRILRADSFTLLLLLIHHQDLLH